MSSCIFQVRHVFFLATSWSFIAFSNYYIRFMTSFRDLLHLYEWFLHHAVQTFSIWQTWFECNFSLLNNEENYKILSWWKRATLSYQKCAGCVSNDEWFNKYYNIRVTNFCVSGHLVYTLYFLVLINYRSYWEKILTWMSHFLIYEPTGNKVCSHFKALIHALET